MITWLAGIVTGRARHWREANTAYINVLVEVSKEFPPAIAPLFKEFTIASYIIVKRLVMSNGGTEQIIKIDLKNISPEQFQSLHNLNIWTFLALFSHQNPQYRDSFFAACNDFIGIRENESRMVQFVSNMDDIDVGNICATLYSEISKILRIKSDGLVDWLMLTPTFSYAYSDAMESYKREMANLK